MLFKVLFIGHKQQHCGDLKRVLGLFEFSHFNNAFKICMIALARSGNKLWCEKVTTTKVFHNKFYILNRAAIEK